MPLAQKEPDEMLKLKEVTGRPIERFVDHFRSESGKCTATDFGRHSEAVGEVGRRLLEFRGRGERIVINEIGPGMVERSGISLRGRDITKRNASFEPFELLNEIKKVGIRPEEFTLYVMDIRKDVLIAVKSTKVLKVSALDRNIRHFKEFFPEFHGEEKDGLIPVRIPEEYRKRVVCPQPFDIREKSAPEKAHITVSVIYELPTPPSIENLVKSTRKGGYIISYWDFGKEAEKKFNLEPVESENCLLPIYRVL